MKKLFIIALSFALCMSLSVVVSAGTQTGNMTVTALVEPSCNMVVGNLDFGTFSGGSVNSTTTVTVNCALGTTYSMIYGLGQQPAGNLRAMSDGNEPVPNLIYYNLYCGSEPGVDAEAGVNPCGDGDEYGIAPGGTASGNDDIFEVLGVTQDPGGITPPSGSYSDSVQITLTFN
jgi:spore coat protein U-like protein